jgi:hypothetical protein
MSFFWGGGCVIELHDGNNEYGIVARCREARLAAVEAKNNLVFLIDAFAKGLGNCASIRQRVTTKKLELVKDNAAVLDRDRRFVSIRKIIAAS